jgi:YVTN family beta-propeller protein
MLASVSRDVRHLCRFAAVMAILGCTSEPSDPGQLMLSVMTAGVDLDSDGYFYSLDTNPATPLGTNETVTINGLNVGIHQLTIDGVADNCTLSGSNPISVAVTSGDTRVVEIAVECEEASSAGSFPVVLATVPVTGQPYGVAVSASGVIYAALIGSTALARGDLTSRTFSSSVQVGSTPPHVVFNPAGTTAYATLQTGQGLAVVDVATNALVTTVPLSSDGFNLIVSPNGQRVYVTTADGTLYVIDASDNSVVTTVAVGVAANGLAFSPDGSVLYVSSRDAGTVVAIDPLTNAVTRTYSLGGMPQRLAVSPDGSELYVANETSGLNVVNVASGTVTSTSFGTAAYGLGVTPDGGYLYVLLPTLGELRVLDRATRAPVKTLAVGGVPRNVVFAADGKTALVANEQAVVFVGEPSTP